MSSFKPIGADPITGELPEVVEERIAALVAVGLVPALAPAAAATPAENVTALNALFASGADVVQLRPGEIYEVDSDLIFQSSQIVFGNGATVRLVSNRSTWNRIATSATDVTVSGVIFDANNHVTANGKMLTNNGGGARWRIVNNLFKNTGGDPSVTTWQGSVYFKNGDDIVIAGNMFDGCSAPIFAGQGQASDGVSATNVTIERNYITGYEGKGIECRGGTMNPGCFRVLNNKVVTPYTGVVDAAPIFIDGRKNEGVAPTGTPTNSIEDVVVANNTVLGNDTYEDTGDLIRIRGVHGGQVYGNFVKNGGDKGIVVSYGSRNVAVFGNTVERTDSDGIIMGFPDATFDLAVTQSFGLIVSGNVIRDIGLDRDGGPATVNYGIRAQNGYGYTIVGNTLYDSQATPTSDNIVRIMPDVRRLEIHGNQYYFAGTEPSSVTTYGVARDDASSGSLPTDYYIDNRYGRYRRKRRSINTSPVSALEWKQWTEFFKTETAVAETTIPWTYAMSAESSLVVRAKVSWAKSDMAHRGTYEIVGMFYRNGSADVTQQGATATVVSIESLAGNDAAFTIDVTTQSVRLSLTSASAASVDWLVTMQVEEIVG